VANDFLGTFNKSQFDRLVAYLRAQVAAIDARLLHLQRELDRIGVFTFTYDTKGEVIGWSIDNADSYLGRLMSAYEVLGGDPWYDLQLRGRDKPIFLVAGTELTPSQIMSSGDVLGTKGLADAATAELIRSIRDGFESVIQERRDYLERKIRRMVDYSDQLQDRISTLKLLKKGKDVNGSLENQIAAVLELISDKSYRAVYDDKGQDPSGRRTRAPFAAYDPGPSRPDVETYERDGDGAQAPGTKTT